MFEKAVRNKFRFDFKGQTTAEDLWDLSLKELDGIYQGLMSKIKAAENISLLSRPNKETDMLKDKAAIVEHIVRTKMLEQQEKEQALKDRADNEFIMDILEQRRKQQYANMSDDELRAKLK